MSADTIAIALSVAVAGLSYSGRTFIAWHNNKAESYRALVDSLQRLAALLKTSNDIFILQAIQRDRLDASINAQFPELEDSRGFESKFVRAFDRFTPAQKDLHAIIRAITELAVQQVNNALRDWIAADRVFKTKSAPLKNPGEIARWLFQLELHLTLWQAKFAYWMVDERHSLVYMGDEDEHGIPFPKGIDQVVDQTLQELHQAATTEIPVPAG